VQLKDTEHIKKEDKFFIYFFNLKGKFIFEEDIMNSKLKEEIKFYFNHCCFAFLIALSIEIVFLEESKKFFNSKVLGFINIFMFLKNI